MHTGDLGVPAARWARSSVGLATRIMEPHRWRFGWVFEFADASLEKRDVLLEKARSSDFATDSIFAVVWPVVRYAATTSRLVSVAFLYRW